MQSQETIAVLIALGCLAMLILVVVIIMFVAIYQRKMLLKEAKIQLMEQEKQIALFKASVEAEEQQKEKIARNLHDEINPLLTILKFNLSKHRIEIQKNKFEPDSLIADGAILDKAIEGIRTTCLELIPTFLIQYGLVKSLEDYINTIAKTTTVKTEFANETNTNDLSLLDKQMQLNIYRICLELINNLIKHAQLTVLKMNLHYANNTCVITLTHNGKGITNQEIETLAESSSGLGLKSLQARALILNATIDYQKQTQYSSVALSIPLANE